MADAENDTAFDARAAAEARRQRILAKSESRLKAVSGEASSSGGGEEGGQSKGSRLSAMRRRRYKKAAPSETENKLESSEKESTETSADAPKEPEEPASPPEVPPDTVEEDNDTEQSKEEGGTKKQYVGVAKMRRKMIADKKKAQAEKDMVSQRSMKAAEMTIKAKAAVPSRHIYFYLLTAFFLFLSGLSFGLQQHGPIQTIESVHRKMSIQEIGIGVLHSKSESPIKRLFRGNVKESRAPTLEEEDEFGGATEPIGVTDSPNIDPLFGVDLDELTKGSGFFYSLARFAVSVHRFFLYLFLTLPKKMMVRLTEVPRRLVASPPIFWVVALLLRAGFKALGAKLPDTTPINCSEKGDLLSSFKKTVSSMVTQSIPTISNLYFSYRDARADMYVILCGFFLGLALPIHFVAESGENEEL